MTGHLIRGSSQITAQTIVLSLLDPALSLPDSYLANGANFIKRDGSISFNGNISIGNNRITGLANGVSGTDAINLNQLLNFANGLSIHNPRLVSVVNISSLSGTGTNIDNTAVAVGDEILLTAQSTGSQNGPWIVQSSSWTRPAYFASGNVEQDAQYFITGPEGSSTYKNTKWYISNTSAITVDTTAITFQQDLSGTIYSFSSGLAQSGNTVTVARGNGISLDGSNNLTITSDPNRLLQTVGAGIGIKDGTAAQIIMANSSGNASYQTVSGDLTISSSGVTTINHTAGSGFLKYTDIVANEVPGGTPNGSTTSFSLANTPQNSSLTLFKNGQLQKSGSGNDYTISGANITYLTAPQTGDQLTACYVK